MASDQNIRPLAREHATTNCSFLRLPFEMRHPPAPCCFLLTRAKFREEMGFPGRPDTISLQLLASCLFVFGLGYYWVSRDLLRNRDLVKLGVIGKPLVFLVFFGHALAQEIPVVLVIPSLLDLLFGALFMEFLVRSRGQSQ
jgi:hypothetical protein